MARTKQTAKKTTGIDAPRVVLKIPRREAAASATLKRPAVIKIRQTASDTALIPAPPDGPCRLPVEALMDSEPSNQGCSLNNDFCHICGDGGSLYSCDNCPRAACLKCLPVPDKHVTLVVASDVRFLCVSCHWKDNTRSGEVTPYMGFYRDGKPVLETFLKIPASFNFSIHSMISSQKTAIVHLRVHTINPGGPVAMLEHFFQPYFTHSGELIVKNIVFNLTTNAMVTQYKREAVAVAADIGNTCNCNVLFTVLVHSDEDRGDLTTGFSRQRKREVSSTVASVLDILLTPFEKITPNAMVVMLACGSVIKQDESFEGLYKSIKRFQFSCAVAFDADRLHPTSCWPFVIFLCQAVFIEGHKLDTAVPHALANSNDLGLHSGIYIFSRVTDRLVVTKYLWSHRDFRPWGTVLPAQCPECGTPQKWRRTVEENARGEDGAIYKFNCRYKDCGRGQIVVRKPKGVKLIPQGSTKISGWLSLQVVS